MLIENLIKKVSKTKVESKIEIAEQRYSSLDKSLKNETYQGGAKHISYNGQNAVQLCITSTTEQKNWLLMLAAHYDSLTSFLVKYTQEFEENMVTEAMKGTLKPHYL